jgi:hypothetical protein
MVRAAALPVRVPAPVVPSTALRVRARRLQGRPIATEERDIAAETGAFALEGEIGPLSCVSAGVLRRVAALLLPIAALLVSACSNSVDLSAGNEDLHPLLPGAPIGFDDLVTGTDVSAQYPHATFSSDPGCACQASDAAGMAASAPNYIFTYYTCPNGASASVFVDFDVPVHELSFKGVGVNGAAKVATLRVTNDEGVQTVDMVGQGDPTTPVQVDLTKFQHVTRLEIVDVNDDYGMGFDDFVFQPQSAGHDPEKAPK